MIRKLLDQFFPSNSPPTSPTKSVEDARIASLKEFKKKQHLFIFGLCGRSASTALQRILNSSNEVSIWGESWGAIDHLLDAYYGLKGLHDTYENNGRNANVAIYKNSFKQQTHNQWYATAFKKVDKSILDNIENEIIELLYDKDIAIERIGYKDIGIYKENTLPYLKRFFPNSKTVLIFRNPITQWNSVKNAGYWPYSKEVNLFIEEYTLVANTYFDFFQNNRTNCIFFENTDLKSPTVVKGLVESLELSSFDNTLLNTKVNSTSSSNPDKEEEQIIEKSEAFQWYQRILNHKFKI